LTPIRSFIAFATASWITVGILPAQPDPVFNCRIRASELINTPWTDVSAQWRSAPSKGDDTILWKAKLANRNTATGFCEVHPQTGRVVRLGADHDSAYFNHPMTPADAESSCRREARAQFSPGNGLMDAVFLPNTSTKSVFRVSWRLNSMAGAIRKGRCEIDTATGKIREFHTSDSW
jgi:hypothetical protein